MEKAIKILNGVEKYSKNVGVCANIASVTLVIIVKLGKGE